MAAKSEYSSGVVVNFSLLFTATKVNAGEDVSARYGEFILGEISGGRRVIIVIDSVAATSPRTISVNI